ncbi:MAG: hypothetical protein JJE04_20845 [Acidobacteriia bacterium]|nr:hypothetical protein [Terriglobia bacterium]
MSAKRRAKESAPPPALADLKREKLPVTNPLWSGAANATAREEKPDAGDASVKPTLANLDYLFLDARNRGGVEVLHDPSQPRKRPFRFDARIGGFARFLTHAGSGPGSLRIPASLLPLGGHC